MGNQYKKEFISEHGEKNLLYYVLLHHIRNNYLEFAGNKTSNLSKIFIKDYIEKKGVFINNILIKGSGHTLREGDQVSLKNTEINFICEQGKMVIKDSVPKINTEVTLHPMVQKQPTDVIDAEVIKYLKDKFTIEDAENIHFENPKMTFFVYYSILKEFGIDKIKNSTYGNQITLFIKDHIKDNAKLLKELNLENTKIVFSGKVLDILIEAENETKKSLYQLIESFESGIYDSMLYNFLRDYNKLYSSFIFQYFLMPQLSYNLSNKVAIESLIKPVNDAPKEQGAEEKFLHFEKSKQIFDNYSSLINDTLEFDLLFKRISNYCFKLLKISCDTLEVKEASIFIEPTLKKYNFHNTERERFDIFFKIINKGAGLARDLNITSQSPSFCFEEYNIGILKPFESREFHISTEVRITAEFNHEICLQLTWEDISHNKKELREKIILGTQNTVIPWEEIEKRKLYTIQAIENKEKLYGRDEILEELKNNVLSTQIESYKVWGQKRVGKSSIVKTLRTLLQNESKIIVVYRSMAGLVNAYAEKTLNTLGESLCSEIFNEIDRKIQEPSIRERLKNISVPEFDGSLYPLEIYITKLRNEDKSLKFIFILDEFDRINDEFFLPGKLGDTLSLNIGKGLNEYSFVGFILVGSENMHLLDRQGINYNSYQEKEVDTFNKTTEFDSFQKIITEPVTPFLIYSPESIEQIYTYTNGNPYFANLICSHIFKIAVHNKDIEIDVLTTDKAISNIVNSSQKSHFEHFWGDGITEETNIKKERKADIRRRVLISYSYAYSQSNEFPNRQAISRGFNKPSEYELNNFEIENTIKEFFNRKIFIEDTSGKIRIIPPIFEKWLCGPGRVLMIEGISDLEALQREKQLEVEYALKDYELKRISENLIFKGEKISYSDIEKYFNQFGGAISQRRVFKIIDSITYLSKDEIIDFFKSEQKNIFTKSNIVIREGARKIFREGIELYSFPESINENIEIIDSFKIHSYIRSTKILKDIKKDMDSWKHSNISDIIIFESVVENYQNIKKDLEQFLSSKLLFSKIPIKFVVLLITNKAKAEIIRNTSHISNFKLIPYKEIEETKIKPFVEANEIFETSDESGFAFAEVRKQFQKFNKESLNVLFESHCPAKSLPILWCKTNNFKPLFPNEFGNSHEDLNVGEVLRTRLFKANTELSQKMNNYIVNYLKTKATNLGLADWFRVELIPKKVLETVTLKYIADDQKNNRETYFEFLDYKKIIEQDPELIRIFRLKSDQLQWLDRLNELRRDPAHPEKPAPRLIDVEYFEKIKNEVLSKIE